MIRALAVLLIAAALFIPTNEDDDTEPGPGHYWDCTDVKDSRDCKLVPEPWTCIAGGQVVWKVFCARFWIGEQK
jgi:hypothetical protein